MDLSVPAVPIRRAHFLLCPAGTCLLPPPKPVPRWTTPSAISDASQNKLKLFPNESSHKTEDSLQPRDSSEQKQGTQGTKSRSIQRLTEEQVWRGLPCGSDSKESACNAGDPGSIPGSRRPSGEGNGSPLQYSRLENSWTEEPGRLHYGVAKSRTRLSN